MALLRAAASAALGLAAGCYNPQFDDCVVSCARDGDCGPDQVCNSLQLCAAPNAGTCGHATPDAASVDGSVAPIVDAIGDAGATPDAAAPPDAAPLVDAAPPPPPPPPDAAPLRHPLKVSLGGSGRIEIVGVGSCTSECDFDVLPGTYTLRGEADEDWRIDRWQADCADSGSADTCVLMIAGAAHGRLKLRRD